MNQPPISINDAAEIAKLKSILASVTDPEIPALTIAEMGILRDVKIIDGRVEVIITPTYSGCPAMQQIEEDVSAELAKHGYTDSKINLVLSPAWTTDWMSEESKQKLRDYGIAAPCMTSALNSEEAILNFKATCPQCQSVDTELVSEFGSTACKALWKCRQCKEPFDYFKPL